MKRLTQQSIPIPTIYDDAYLSFFEGSHHVPFNIKRIYIIHHCLPHLDRGHHAHKKTDQMMVCLAGSLDLILDDGRKKRKFHLSKSNKGILIHHLVWHEMKNITPDAIMLVAASRYFDERDYIRRYDAFRLFLKNSV